MSKICITCKEKKELKSFHRRPEISDGRSPICISCKKAYDKELEKRKKDGTIKAF